MRWTITTTTACFSDTYHRHSLLLSPLLLLLLLIYNTITGDDMSDDLYAYGSREIVADYVAANDQQRRTRHQRGLLRKSKKN
jgi:hypothetical protein